ncbi:MAG: UBP-type zinc finger domain-containing protein [Chryseolinea sp.]
MHLRTCQTCGKTLCCDSSPSKHASKHFKTTGHPVMASAEPGERWIWCFVHEQILGY